MSGPTERWTYSVRDNFFAIHPESGGETIAETCGGTGPDEEAKARLLAAAPDLLAMCRRLQATCHRLADAAHELGMHSLGNTLRVEQIDLEIAIENAAQPKESSRS